jgi:hypothetical protein
MPVSKTDLPDACGISLYPCVAKIGACATDHIYPSVGGKLTPSASICNCFSRAYSESIPVPHKPDVEITCPFQCVDAILKYTDLYVVKVNGPGDDLAHHCDQSMSLLGQVEFGNKNDYTPSASDADSLVVLPVDDARVVRASDALAQHINLERQKTCPAKSPVSTGEDSKKIVYARRGMVDFGRGQYKLEVLFGTEVFFARVVHLPKSEQLIEPSDSNEDPENFDGRFAVVHVTPDPCGDAVAEQLAVSVSGAFAAPARPTPACGIQAARPRAADGAGASVARRRSRPARRRRPAG